MKREFYRFYTEWELSPSRGPDYDLFTKKDTLSANLLTQG